MLLSHTLTTWRSLVASLVFSGLENLSGLGGETDRQWPFDPTQKSHGAEWKIMLLSHTLTTWRSLVASLVFSGLENLSGLGGETDRQRVTFWSHTKITWGRVKNNVAVTHPYHMEKSCSKFGKIQPSDLGGNSVTDRGVYNSHIALKHGDNNNNKAKRKNKKR